MKAILKKYVSLAIMLLLLVLVISFLPAEASHETSYGYKDSPAPVKEVSLTVGVAVKR
jgi:hypothetical protein